MDLSTIYGVNGISRGFARIRGRSGAVGAAFELINPFGTDREFNTILATAAALDYTSSSTDDDAGGIGALTLRTYGLGAAFQPVSEDITLDGRTAVTGTVAFSRVHGMKILTAGTSRVNVGDIYAVATGTSTWTNGVPDTLTSSVMKILAGYGEDMMGCWTTPVASQWKLVKLIVGGTGAAFTLGLFSRPLAGAATTRVLRLERAWDCFTIGPKEIDVSDLPALPPLTDILFKGLSVGASLVSVDALFQRQP
jgi:hypothetical protein